MPAGYEITEADLADRNHPAYTGPAVYEQPTGAGLPPSRSSQPCAWQEEEGAEGPMAKRPRLVENDVAQVWLSFEKKNACYRNARVPLRLSLSPSLSLSLRLSLALSYTHLTQPTICSV